MENHEQEPNGALNAILSPAAPSSASNRTNFRLLEWLRGPGDSHIVFQTDEAALEAWTSHWDSKWKDFQETYPDTSATLALMSRHEMSDHVRNTEAEITRVWGRWSELHIKDDEAEIQAGSMFIGKLVDEIPPLTSWLNQRLHQESDHSEYIPQVQQLEKVYQFCLQSFSYVINQRQTKTVRRLRFLPDRGASDPLPDFEQTNRDNIPLSTLNVSDPRPGTSGSPHMSRPSSTSQSMDAVAFPIPSVFPAGNQPQTGPFIFPAEAQGLPTPQAPANAGVNGAFTVPLSSTTQYKANLTSLLAISFFGASISWSVVFSGTRGDLIIISWSASVFIVGTICAASGSILVETDDNIMNRFVHVRWVVRVLTILSMLHVFAGLTLISIALLLFDPNASQPQSEVTADGAFSLRASIAAGAYAVSMNSLVAIFALLVRRRYSRRTWFT
ncbi:hypothetical protein WG66_010276 [Moniliophthora roreri]|nr:hypothetical protein WG66_010276 [Moniliophthora roreri]